VCGSGLLQWVDNTMSLNMYLVDGYGGFAGAHQRYQQPGEYTHKECQMIAYKAQTERPIGEAWQAAYDDITSKFPPILRKFFLERYQSASHWCVGSSSVKLKRACVC
jgi:phosphatidylinositol kinase/protein kinase (PI-3  family)